MRERGREGGRKEGGREQERAKERERHAKTGAMIFYNLILEVTSCHFLPILFLRSKSLNPAYTQVGEGITQGVGTRRQRSLEAILDTA